MLKKFKKLVNGKQNLFLLNLGWLGASEVIVRITRLFTAIILARLLDPITFGLAALVLTINELVKVFSRNGIGAKIIQCKDDELEQICNTAYRLNFIFCLSLFLLQCLLAYPLAVWFNQAELVPMLQVLAITYLLMPFAMVQSALILRQQKLKTSAMIDGGQVAVDNILTAILALLGLGAWAIILPKFLTTPIWVIGYRKAISWSPSRGFFKLTLWRDVLEFGRYYLSIEVLKTARLNLDNLIIGRILGMEALGVYYFARNAGLGFSLTLINAVNSALYPNLCELKTNIHELKTRFNSNVIRILWIVFPLLIAQASLAFWYVPIVFGEQWVHAIPVLSLLCLSAIPRALSESASALVLATGHIRTDFIWNISFTFLFIVSVFVAANFSILSVAVTILCLYLLTNPLYFFYARRLCFESVNNKNTFDQKSLDYAN